MLPISGGTPGWNVQIAKLPEDTMAAADDVEVDDVEVNDVEAALAAAVVVVVTVVVVAVTVLVVAAMVTVVLVVTVPGTASVAGRVVDSKKQSKKKEKTDNCIESTRRGVG